MKLKAIIFGSTGMIGQGVLMECLESADVESVLLINRRALNSRHPKVQEIIHPDFNDMSSLIPEFKNYNTCFYSLGVSAVGLSEAAYHSITYDLTVKIAEAILKTGQDFTFCYISGKSTDSTEKGRSMWARVKGKLENKLLSMPFKNAYMFRPGYIQPLKGIRSRTRWYNIVYTVFKPLYFLLKPLKKYVTNTSSLAKAMIRVAANGYEKRILESADINKLAEAN
jgi:hypothetical protein